MRQLHVPEQQHHEEEDQQTRKGSFNNSTREGKLEARRPEKEEGTGEHKKMGKEGLMHPASAGL